MGRKEQRVGCVGHIYGDPCSDAMVRSVTARLTPVKAPLFGMGHEVETTKRRSCDWQVGKFYYTTSLTWQLRALTGLYERSLAVETVFLVWDRCGCWFFWHEFAIVEVVVTVFFPFGGIAPGFLCAGRNKRAARRTDGRTMIFFDVQKFIWRMIWLFYVPRFSDHQDLKPYY
jgi:hypothetical protein